jgi:hypothetical protein
MNRGRAITVIKQQLGFKTTLDSEIGNYIDDAQEFLETNYPHGELPWFMLSERAATSTKENEERVEVPDDFVQEYEEGALWLVNSDGGEILLHKYDADDSRNSAQARYNYGELDQPTEDWPNCYALTGKYFRLFPKPLEVISVKIMYYKRLALTVELEDENDWLKHAPYLIIGWAGERMATALRDANALGVFSGWKGAAVETLTNRNIERKYANRRMAMGETR